MTENPKSHEPFSLRRWSRRKREAVAGGDAAAGEEASSATPSAMPMAPQATPGVVPTSAAAKGQPVATPASTAGSAEEVPQPEPLPPVESLTLESDFSVFLKAGVDPSLKRQALKKLFSDPHFNTMDGLDVYIDDYTKTVPITPDMLARLEHAKRVLFPPKTRVNAQGIVEDIPDTLEEGLQPRAQANAPNATSPAIETTAALTAPAETPIAATTGMTPTQDERHAGPSGGPARSGTNDPMRPTLPEGSKDGSR